MVRGILQTKTKQRAAKMMKGRSTISRSALLLHMPRVRSIQYSSC
jgi:hypothetical protein